MGERRADPACHVEATMQSLSGSVAMVTVGTALEKGNRGDRGSGADARWFHQWWCQLCCGVSAEPLGIYSMIWI